MSLTTLPKSAFQTVERVLGDYAETTLNKLFKDKNTINVDRETLSTLMLGDADGIATLFRQWRNTGEGKVKKTKDPNAPKRAPSAYLMWLNENRQSIIDEHFDEELTGRDKVAKVGKKAGEVWKAMSEDEKADYVTRSKQLQEEYKAAMAKYKPSAVISTSSKKPINLDFESLPEAPEEWTGPFNGKKLRGLANGGKLGVGKFYSFDEAAKAADELGESCSGITYEAKTGKYSLRKKFEWCGDGVEGEDCSWVQGEITVCIPKPKANKPKAKKAEKPKATKPKKAEKPKATKAKKAEEPKKVEKPKTKKAKKVAVAPEPEPEPEVVEEDEEEEEVSVRKWSYEGKQYLLDDASGEVYDIETQDVIGTLQEDGTVEFDE